MQTFAPTRESKSRPHAQQSKTLLLRHQGRQSKTGLSPLKEEFLETKLITNPFSHGSIIRQNFF